MGIAPEPEGKLLGEDFSDWSDLVQRAIHLLRVIRPAHTLFALPFAYLGAILGSSGLPSANQLGWITVAMFAARSFAMAWNRWIDRDIDALNPRTAHREIPAGLVSGKDIAWVIGGSLLLLLVAAWRLHPICLRVYPLAVAIPWAYSYTKRFTYLSHWVLGLSLAFGPIGAWLAVAGNLPAAAYTWAAAVVLWVAGFDIFYQAQDVHFDRAHGLYSIPACFGIHRAVNIAVFLHVLSWGLLVLGGIQSNLGKWHYLGIIAVALLFGAEYLFVRSRSPEGFARAFQINLLVSVVLLVFTGLDLLL